MLPVDICLGDILQIRINIAKFVGSGLICTVTSQNDDLQRTIEQLHYQGAEDILVNAPQQSAYGYQVGYNHPELQYTLDGKRYYVLWLTEESKLAQYKAQRIAANDPEHGGIEIRTVREYDDPATKTFIRSAS